MLIAFPLVAFKIFFFAIILFYTIKQKTSIVTCCKIPVCTPVWQEQTNSWLLPKINITVFNQALANLAENFGNRENKHMILVLDRAGRHSSQKLKIPEGLHLEPIPAHTPELQPAKRL
ncbi:MAG: hypothetical protein O4861_10765 [Trichodesmium sp. St16_bin4-tuft]|nr:hypothetical protein [Trichodesmium sp. St5_bin8]MDE5098786.1 hypothetical protein [Trichodesmium sp. St16_bin4-tuft]